MSPRAPSLDEAAKGVLETLEKAFFGQPESALAKALVVAAAVALGSPWLAAAEPILVRVFQFLNNGSGKKAVAEIAGEIKTEEGFRRTAAAVAEQIRPVLETLYAQQEERSGMAAALRSIGQSPRNPYTDDRWNAVARQLDRVQSDIADILPRLVVVMNRLLDEEHTDGFQPLAANIGLQGSGCRLNIEAIPDQGVPQQIVGFDYRSFKALRFDLTNMGHIDLRILDMWIEVIQFIPIDIAQIIEPGDGHAGETRKGHVVLCPSEGRYRCCLDGEDENTYLALSAGELEYFSIELQTPANEGVYRLRLAADCSVGGKTVAQQFASVFEFGVFQGDAHKWVQQSPCR